MTHWVVEEEPLNPFHVRGFNGTCRFPQITREGLEDSWQHGRDIYEVYHDLLHFIPETLDTKKVRFRATNNVITSQVAGMLIGGMYGPEDGVSLLVQVCSYSSLFN